MKKQPVSKKKKTYQNKQPFTT